MLIMSDGSLDFSGGVNSIKVTTIASQQNPGGLARNELAWLVNATVRDGGITPRAGWQPIGRMHAGDMLYQGGFMYQPIGDFPYLVHGIGGVLYRQDTFTGLLTPLSGDPALTHPATEPHFYFAQAEEFLIIQAGDLVTLPLFWDGNNLTRSRGLNGDLNPLSPTHQQIPAATAMEYYMGRLFYAVRRLVSGGDLVFGPSGTVAYDLRDSVLGVTENPLSLAGDGFTVALHDGNIRGLKAGAAIDAALGQGRLFIATTKAVYALQVPVTRTDWIGASNNNQPLMTVVQLVNGSVNDRSIVAANGDLFYQTLEPGIRSLFQSIRTFQQWGNVNISSNENRVLQFNDRALLSGASGIVFNNRMFQTALPFETPAGIAHSAIIPMDFVPISGFGREVPPNWEGVYDGLNHHQLFVGDFGGRERAFSVVNSTEDGSLNLFELTFGDRFENGDNRIQMQMEFPAYTFGREFDLKRLLAAELTVDRLYGTVLFTLEFRPDGQTCWNHWHTWEVCSPRNSAENCVNPITYPLEQYGECYKNSMIMPRPPEKCAECSTGRPANIFYQVQPRLTVKGFCRIRGLLLHADSFGRRLYQNIQC